ncbi:carbohydrate ABC transporter permease [Phototrophicus methaneseepsis]|uniref:Carbohydrate ABC transporter permease n=1 Tax=Phototrophicus methaneseepsis TaxID=2710758 RepID=A0A7S8E9H6_9CHLR|nr:carbohydrate ABC transporter permease [Phototrophicus methaneseepsis]QPC82878.1 carbohydrate ABC transporter permease [Phototrophicus methaneseepsis]
MANVTTTPTQGNTIATVRDFPIGDVVTIFLGGLLALMTVGILTGGVSFTVDAMWLLPLATGVAAVVLGILSILNPDRSRLFSVGVMILGLFSFVFTATYIIDACSLEEPNLDGMLALAGAAAAGLIVQAVIPRPEAHEIEVPWGSDTLRRRSPVEVFTGWLQSITLGKFVLYVLLTFAAVVAMVPFLWMITNSLMTLGEVLNRALLPADPVNGVCNYVEAWNEANFSRYFFNSIVITLITITGLLVTSVLSAYAFARIDFIGRNTIFTLLLITLMIPESVTMIPNFLIITGNVPVIPSLADDSLAIVFDRNWLDTLTALTLPFMANAFSIFLLRQFFSTIPNELWEACRIDGGGHLRFLLQIVLPIARPAILTVTLLTFISAWNAFIWPLIVTRTDEWRPLMVGLYNFTQESGTQLHLLMAGSFITIFPILLLYFATQKAFTEGIATSGLKG